jgi:hypothetical protein
MKQLSLLVAYLCSASFLLAQYLPKAAVLTSANHFILNPSSSGGNDVSFSNFSPYQYFWGGLWLGAINGGDGSLRTATKTYPTSGYDFITGPLTINKSDDERAKIAARFDKVWSVTSVEISKHLEDFKDGKIDNPIFNVMAWPAKGNPHFEQYNLFKNEFDNQDLAPFKDVNNDGIYTPMQGDYPYINQADEKHQPDEIFWSVFNDNCHHSQSKGKPLFIEIQQTGWAYTCSDNTVLNNSVFFSYKLINKGTSTLDSLMLGYWTDFELNCKGTYYGCSPTNNAFFTYYRKEKEDCAFSPFKNKISPALSVNFLNKSMSNFMIYDNAASFGTLGKPWKTDPNHVIDFYRYMNSTWKDGKPLTRGGEGYNPSSTDYTKYIYDGNPTDNQQWSMKTTNADTSDYRGIGSVTLKSLAPGAVAIVDMVIAKHQDSTLINNSANIQKMYQSFGTIQTLYNQRFNSVCQKEICQDDCVFPGDANNDGRADVKDYLSIVTQLAKKGTKRENIVIWKGESVANWDNQTIFNLNVKHADCDGNGLIEEKDKNVLHENYRKIHAKFQLKDDVYLKNEQLLTKIIGADSLQISDLTKPSPQLRVIPSPQLINDSVFAYCAELAYDKRFFNNLNASIHFYKNIDNVNTREFHFSTTAINSSYPIKLSYSSEINSSKKVPAPCTEIIFKNIQAVKKDGSIIPNVGARIVQICFTKNLVNNNDLYEQLNHVRLFPNPVGDVLNIENNELQNIDYQIFNIQGQILLQGHVDANQTQQISMTALSNGVYFVKMNDVDAKILTQKIIKMKD